MQHAHLIAAAAILAIAMSAPTQSCKVALWESGVSTRFDETVAHAIHSITLNDLRKFNPRVPTANGVPTVNRAIALSPKDRVVRDAPEVTLPEDFTTHAMRLFDNTLAHATDRSDGLGDNWNTLERVAHMLHMNDLWARVGQEYPTIQNVSDAGCACITDTGVNGIEARLLWIAEQYTHDTPISLHEWGTKIPKLTLSTWPEWKKRLAYYYDTPSLKDAAVYLHCALRRF
eukprot:TRINITY_DN410_c0_g1_i12.p1 TRINITY_DN410_c0_g1~~TRINITY_DN410_c0_g1_i12.p1  ORF type:complete len:230 (+),score=70.45 TRINITY_DN410_c0_g1_i12:222-911(+)